MTSLKPNYVLKALIVTLCVMIIACFTGCSKKNNKEENKPPVVEITNEVEESKILEGTIYETKVYTFKSNIEGPKVAIVGGIHGDEVAGWSAALKLIERRDFKGEVMIIPQASILADTLEQRYPGINSGKVYNGVTYSDLNRTFPGKENGTATQKIAYAITKKVEEFAPDHVIDLHESRRSATHPTKPLLGDLIIYANSNTSLFAMDMTFEFNENCKKIGEVDFGSDTNAPDGSFNKYFGEKYPDGYVFTIETNRELKLERRIEQQTQMLDIFFKLIWD